MLAAMVLSTGEATAAPRTPASDTDVLAELPVGVRYRPPPAQTLSATRLDVALALAQIDIAQARLTGDMRFLGYAEAVLEPWIKQSNPAPQVLILNASVLQSRHAFAAALTELDHALTLRPEDAQAWLSRATILRVLGRYDEASLACRQLAATADPAVTTLCREGVRGLSGHLQEAAAALASLTEQGLSTETRAWRYSELGEMAERLGDDGAAERWFRSGLKLAPTDFYMRTAYADLLLRAGRPQEVLTLLAGYEALEPLLLRAAIAHELLKDQAGSQANVQLATVFQTEQQRGDSVHRRELARYLLDVTHQPDAALSAAQDNWRVQREPDDLLILLRAAYAAGQPAGAVPARAFMSATHIEDVRLDPYRKGT